MRETLFDKLNPFSVMYTSEQLLFKNLAIFDFISICVQQEAFREINTTIWIGKHVPITLSISSNHLEETIFLYNSDPHHLIASYIGTVEGLASQSKAPMELLFLDIETTFDIRLGSVLEKLTERHNRREHARFYMSQVGCDNEICASTQFLQIQKSQLFDLQDFLERYCNNLHVFRFNSAKYDLILIKS